MAFMFSTRRAWPLAVALSVVATPASALTFNFVNSGSSPVPANFMTAAVAAGNLWSGYFNDPIQLNITLSYGASDAGASVAGSGGVAYSTVRQALINDVVSPADLSATSFLQASAPVQFLINRTTTGPLRMDTGTSGNANDDNNNFIVVHRALAKALGLVAGNDIGSDGTVLLSSSPGVTYDIDRSDGIEISSYDLIGVIAHEIGHIMGFQTIAEQVSTAGGFTQESGNTPRLADLFRFSSESTNPAGPFAASGAGPGVFDISADTRSKYFSIDGGTTAVAEFARGTSSTASGFGNGQQANHWLNSLTPIGIMDPTIGLGELLSFTPADQQFFDVIGYNPVPEAGTWASGIALAGGFWILRRRSRRAA